MTAKPALSVAEIADRPASKSHQSSMDERRKLIAASLNVGNPPNNARELPDVADPKFDCQMELAVDTIRSYERNPRRANNAKFVEIKESIRCSGIRNPLTVTRRPGEKHFIVEAGGNTRLLAIQQLWEGTRDPRFAKLTALFRPWRSEAHVLSAHLIENEQRGEMTFWDKANGVVALKARIEDEKSRALSLRQVEEELKAMGFSVNTATLTHYLYATTRLRILGDAVPVLSGLDVKTIQPRLNLMKRYVQVRGGPEEAALYAEVFEPVFRRHAEQYRQNQTFKSPDLCEDCEEALARHLGESIARLRTALDALARSPQASLESLSEIANSAPPIAIAPRIEAGSHLPDGTSGVSSANAASEEVEPCVAHHSPAQTAHLAQTDVAELQRLKESIARFAKLKRDVPALTRLDADFFDWLLDGRDEVAAAFWEIVALALELRSTTVQRADGSGPDANARSR